MFESFPPSVVITAMPLSFHGQKDVIRESALSVCSYGCSCGDWVVISCSWGNGDCSFYFCCCGIMVFVVVVIVVAMSIHWSLVSLAVQPSQFPFQTPLRMMLITIPMVAGSLKGKLGKEEQKGSRKEDISMWEGVTKWMSNGVLVVISACQKGEKRGCYRIIGYENWTASNLATATSSMLASIGYARLARSD